MLLFDPSLPFYKGNTHMHTTNSDGDLSPEDAAALYQSNGYDFIVLSDHRKVGSEGAFKNMKILPGVEYDYFSDGRGMHFTAVLPDSSISGESLNMQDPQSVIDAINAHSGAAILAHPVWSLCQVDFMKSFKGFCAVEVYNTFSGIPWNAARADSSQLLDLLFTSGTLMNMVASDDSHRYTGEQCVSYTMVQAESLTAEGIIAALKAGRFYASQGPRILRAEALDDRLIVETTPVKYGVFYSNLDWVHGRCRTADGITRHEYLFNRSRGERYVRAEFIDSEGRKAWLNPIGL